MTAWETTTQDIQTVLDAYHVSLPFQRVEEIHDELDHADIEAGVLYFVTMDAQTASMLSDIEDHLMKTGVVPNGTKKFVVDEINDFEEE